MPLKGRGGINNSQNWPLMQNAKYGKHVDAEYYGFQHHFGK
jgi:hypothetical protein